MRDQLSHESVRVLEGNYALVVESRDRLAELDVVFDESLDPEADGAGQYCKGGNGNLSGPLTSAAGVGPGKERQDAAGGSFRIAKIKVVRSRVIEVHGTLHEAHSENPGVKVEIALRIARYGRDVMDAGDPPRHRFSGRRSA